MSPTGSLVKREIVSQELEWKIPNFTLGEEVYCYGGFKFQNVDWQFAVFTKISDGHIRLCLWRHSSYYPMNVELSVALKTSDGQKCFERGGTEIFDEGKFYSVYRWISRSEFDRRKTEFLSSGCLKLMFALKSVDFVEPARRLHFFRSKYKKISAPISEKSLILSTTSDASKNENAPQEFVWNIGHSSLGERLYFEFTFQTDNWKFVVFPRAGYICLGVSRIAFGSPLLVEFSVALKTLDGQKGFERALTEIFDEWKLGCDYEWINISEFENRKTEFLSSGCLTVMITLKIVDFVPASYLKSYL